MYYSYAMGVGKTIYSLKKQGFKIKKCGSNFKVRFQNEMAKVWEDFVAKNLEIGYWNEYLTNDSVIFLFKLQNGIKRYEVFNFESQEVLELCEKLCKCKFQSIESMLSNNKFYKKIIKSENVGIK